MKVRKERIVDSITNYYENFEPNAKEICSVLAARISQALGPDEAKIWHGHPVWFIDGNPIVGFSLTKNRGVRLMFWSGQSFDEPGLSGRGTKFKDASIFYTDPAEINLSDLARWLKKAQTIQWDYKNIVKRKGELVRLEVGK